MIRGQIHQIRLGLAQHLELLVLLIQDLQQDVGVLTALCLEACITLVGLRLVQLRLFLRVQNSHCYCADSSCLVT